MVRPTRVTDTIRAQRFAHHEMTQAELARRTGVSRQTVAIEQGRYPPSLETAFRIAHVLGVPLDSVLQYSAGGGANGTCATGGTDDEAGEGG
ncbi:helix-turn-helix transcriptional regulator [Streptomyces roseus]|uniref:helix-turn-helix transcriptional regulator n=1 Tax=Streptomyces roseus TaxID=66430 RepID=UPI0036A4FD40